ncbi:PD-(D/E)XK nuclease-like domain-containing protein [Amycolatopsis sp. NPDC001319]|uniref:PD-(D/E)XK nuclease-like domain-containing protein n=1 Tax=unclassified Amycolatopsis TaxID=2618356 RepID=UPI0036743602
MTAQTLGMRLNWSLQAGIYEDFPEEAYHRDPVKGGSFSSSGARSIMAPGCPAKFRHDQLTGRAPKLEFDLGHAAHQLVLGTGPELVLIEADDYRKKDAREARDRAHAAGQVPLLPDEYEQVEAMADALLADPVASRILRPDQGKTELTLVWRDVQTGVMCRARLDYLRQLADGRTFIVDYKTARSAEPSAIERAIYDRGYHQQLDFYTDGVLETGLAKNPVPLLVVQEKTAPYVVTVAAVTKTAMDWGHVLNRAAIDLYARCLATNTWPGYATDVIGAGVPTFAERNYEIALERGDYDIKGKA